MRRPQIPSLSLLPLYHLDSALVSRLHQNYQTLQTLPRKLTVFIHDFLRIVRKQDLNPPRNLRLKRSLDFIMHRALMSIYSPRQRMRQNLPIRSRSHLYRLLDP